MKNTRKNSQNTLVKYGVTILTAVNDKIPRISTRGRFDLLNGKPIFGHSAYTLYPVRSFEKIYGSQEVAVMIHGLRNNPAGALEKFALAKRHLKKLGYVHPVVGFTYDSNTLGAHLKKTEQRALHAGQRIAAHNGKNLAQFLTDFHRRSPATKFRLLGHSLGTEVISSAIRHLDAGKKYDLVLAVYFFGASVPSDIICPTKMGLAMQRTVMQKITNYYSPTDDVLRQASEDGVVREPLGLFGSSGKPISKYVQRRVLPQNHRFASYAKVLKRFP